MKSIKRRIGIGSALLALTSALLMPATASAAALNDADFSNAKIDWKQFSGTTLELGVQTHPWMVAMEKYIPQFEKLTGIKVKYELLGEDVAVPKIKQQLAAGSKTPDLFMVNALGQAAASGWLEPLDSYLIDPKLTDSTWYKVGDIFAGGRSLATFNKKLLAMPITAEVQVLFVRTDLVKKVPKTFEELAVAAKAATKGKVSGFSTRGNPSGNEVPWPFGGFAFPNGGEYIADNGKPKLNSAANVKALKTYASLMKYAPKGASNWAWVENQKAMYNGTLAMFPDSSAFTAGLRDANSSGKTNLNVFPMPSVNGKSQGNVWFWTFGINSKSENKKAAWLFLQWATSAPVTYESQLDVTTARSTAWKNPIAAAGMGEKNADTIADTLAKVETKAMANAWTNANWPKVADALGRAINKTITGGDAKKELDKAQAIAVKALR